MHITINCGYDKLIAIASYILKKHVYNSGSMYRRSTMATPSHVLRCCLLPTDTYAYMEDLMRMDACRPSLGTLTPVTFRAIRIPLHWAEWDWQLESHPDQKFRGLIVKGIREGFRIGFDYLQKCQASRRNMPSAEREQRLFASIC